MPVWKRRPHRVVKPESLSDLLCPELMADPMVHHEELAELLRDPSPLALLTPLPPPPPYFDHDDPVPHHRVDPTEPVEREGMVARLAKLTALGIALVMLCGAVMAAALLAKGGHDITTSRPDAAPTSSMTGVRALIGFATGERHTEQSTESAFRPGSSTPLPTADETATVKEFYRLIDEQPGAAVGLVSPTLLDSDPGELVRSWESVREITLHEVRSEPEGMVHVVLTMVLAGERPVRMTQMLGLASPNGPITEVRLLSSQRTSGTDAGTGG